VDGDGFCFPIDALLVINELNRQGPSGGEGEGESGSGRLLSAKESNRLDALADSVWLDDLFHADVNDSPFSRRGRNRR
jgi:hypothetical protein